MQPTSTPPDATDVIPTQGGPSSSDTEAVEVQRLVKLGQAGDQDAFGKLYDRYYSLVFGVILKQVRHRHLAEDLTSETFLKAWSRITSFAERGAYRSWLLAIAINVVRDHVTSSMSRRERPVGSLIEYDYVDVRVEGNPEGAARRTVDIAAVRAAIAQLPTEEQRRCIVLHFFYDLSSAEIAKEMGISSNNAASALLYRAVRGVASQLRRDGVITKASPDP